MRIIKKWAIVVPKREKEKILILTGIILGSNKIIETTDNGDFIIAYVTKSAYLAWHNFFKEGGVENDV